MNGFRLPRTHILRVGLKVAMTGELDMGEVIAGFEQFGVHTGMARTDPGTPVRLSQFTVRDGITIIGTPSTNVRILGGQSESRTLGVSDLPRTLRRDGGGTARLVGVTVARFATGGHFWAYARPPGCGDRWLRIDDGEVHEDSFNTIPKDRVTAAIYAADEGAPGAIDWKTPVVTEHHVCLCL